MSYYFCLRLIQTFVLGLFLLLPSLSAQEKPIRVRDASGKCGLYIQSALTGNSRKRLSNLEPEAMAAAIKGQKSLKDVEFVILAPESDEKANEFIRFTQAQLAEAGSPDTKVKAYRKGLYVSSLDKPSTGVWVADDDPEAIETFFAAKPDLSNSRLFHVGAGIYDHRRSEVREAITSLMAKYGYEGLKLTMISNPNSLVDDIRWFFPLAEDWQKPTLAELLPSLGFFGLSNATFAAIMLITEERPEHAIPVIIINALQSLAMTVPRQFWGNFFMRARNFTEKFGRQMGISIVFSIGIYAAHMYGKTGLGETLTNILSFAGLALMFSKIWLKALFQTGWRIPVESGIPAWVATETRNGNEHRARAYGTWYRQGATNIATPAWGYSTVTESYLFEFLKKWTWGDVIMVGVGLSFAAANRFPKAYHFPILVVDFAKQKVQAVGRFSGRLKENFKWMTTVSEKLSESNENPWELLRRENQNRVRLFGRDGQRPEPESQEKK